VPKTFTSSAIVTDVPPGQASGVTTLKQTFAAPLLDWRVVVMVPEGSGQRPKVVAACWVQAYVSMTVVPSASKRVTESTLSSSKPNCACSTTRKAPAASDVAAGIA